jgi:hypothetical protein
MSDDLSVEAMKEQVRHFGSEVMAFQTQRNKLWSDFAIEPAQKP